jgi:hypothetical protein
MVRLRPVMRRAAIGRALKVARWSDTATRSAASEATARDPGIPRTCRKAAASFVSEARRRGTALLFRRRLTTRPSIAARRTDRQISDFAETAATSPRCRVIRQPLRGLCPGEATVLCPRLAMQPIARGIVAKTNDNTNQSSYPGEALSAPQMTGRNKQKPRSPQHQ